MAITFNTYNRLEPRPNDRNQQAGFTAAIYDPLWFLARQWQMGEHQGENASSPVWVDYQLRSERVNAADKRFDPTIIPAETIVESEIDDWWTIGRRVRIGKRLLAHQPALQNDSTLLFHQPPPPYEHFDNQPDGLAVWRKRAALGLDDAVFAAAIPPDSIPAWEPSALLYQQTDSNSFDTTQHKLTVQRHRGGRLDWHSVDAFPVPEPAAVTTVHHEAIPTVLQYHGAPANRWWQIEDTTVDIGGYVPDSAHTPTAFLTDLIFSHSDDWFLFPVQGEAGHLIAIDTLQITDGFGRVYKSEDTGNDGKPLWKGLQPPADWNLFLIKGLQPEELLLWHVAELPLISNPVEKVQFGIDEESNLLWAVERNVNGCDVHALETPPQEGIRFNNGTLSGNDREPRSYAYVPGKGITKYWHPYLLIRSEDPDTAPRFVQHRLADLSLKVPALMPAPMAQVLQGNPHEILPLAVPGNGIEVERRWLLARDMNGEPMLWLRRQRKALTAPPARRLRFDVMEEARFE